jgi:hypothetical protein
MPLTLATDVDYLFARQNLIICKALKLYDGEKLEGLREDDALSTCHS